MPYLLLEADEIEDDTDWEVDAADGDILGFKG